MDDRLLDEAETSGFHSWYLIFRDVIMYSAKLKEMGVKTPVMQSNTMQRYRLTLSYYARKSTLPLPLHPSLHPRLYVQQSDYRSAQCAA